MARAIIALIFVACLSGEPRQRMAVLGAGEAAPRRVLSVRATRRPGPEAAPWPQD
jgi:hypothetical protein